MSSLLDESLKGEGEKPKTADYEFSNNFFWDFFVKGFQDFDTVTGHLFNKMDKSLIVRSTFFFGTALLAASFFFTSGPVAWAVATFGMCSKVSPSLRGLNAFLGALLWGKTISIMKWDEIQTLIPENPIKKALVAGLAMVIIGLSVSTGVGALPAGALAHC